MDWACFWHLNPFSRAADAGTVNAHVGMQTSMRIIAAFMIIIESAELILSLVSVAENSATLPQQPQAVLTTSYLMVQSVYGLFAFGLLWKTAGGLNLAADRQGEFAAKQCRALGHIGNFMISWAAFRLFLLLYTASILLEI